MLGTKRQAIHDATSNDDRSRIKSAKQDPELTIPYILVPTPEELAQTVTVSGKPLTVAELQALWAPKKKLSIPAYQCSKANKNSLGVLGVTPISWPSNEEEKENQEFLLGEMPAQIDEAQKPNFLSVVQNCTKMMNFIRVHMNRSKEAGTRTLIEQILLAITLIYDFPGPNQKYAIIFPEFGLGDVRDPGNVFTNEDGESSYTIGGVTDYLFSLESAKEQSSSWNLKLNKKLTQNSDDLLTSLTAKNCFVFLEVKTCTNEVTADAIHEAVCQAYLLMLKRKLELDALIEKARGDEKTIKGYEAERVHVVRFVVTTGFSWAFGVVRKHMTQQTYGWETHGNYNPEDKKLFTEQEVAHIINMLMAWAAPDYDDGKFFPKTFSHNLYHCIGSK